MNYLMIFSLDVPEEEYDSRCLYDRLKEQKDKKQDEWDEAHKLSLSQKVSFFRKYITINCSFWYRKYGSRT